MSVASLASTSVRAKTALAITTMLVASAALFALLPPQAAGAAQTLRYFSPWHLNEGFEFDANDSGRQDEGDYFTGEFVLRKQGENEGHLNFVCARTADSPGRDFCSGAVKISGKGQLTVAGVQETDPEVFNGAITGGTGGFRGASGVMKLVFRRAGISVRFELD